MTLPQTADIGTAFQRRFQPACITHSACPQDKDPVGALGERALR